MSLDHILMQVLIRSAAPGGKKSWKNRLLSLMKQLPFAICSIAGHFQGMVNPQLNSVQWWF